MEYFNYNQVPSNFLHCIVEQCPFQTDCLRRIAYQHIPPEVERVHIINPLKLAAVDKNKCPHFLRLHPIRYAKGFKNALDKLPHKDVQELRKELIDRIGRTRYYRLFREEKLISPHEQKIMQRIFEDHGFPEALHFHEYIDSFVFRPFEIKVSST